MCAQPLPQHQRDQHREEGVSRETNRRREPRRLIGANASMMPAGALMSREQCEALIKKIVGFSKADEISVNVNSGYQTDVRFAANQMSTAGGVMTGGIGVQSTIGKKHAVATTNDLSDESLKATVEKSEHLASLSPDDPESMPGLPLQTYLPVNGYFDSTANA